MLPVLVVDFLLRNRLFSQTERLREGDRAIEFVAYAQENGTHESIFRLIMIPAFEVFWKDCGPNLTSEVMASFVQVTTKVQVTHI